MWPVRAGSSDTGWRGAISLKGLEITAGSYLGGCCVQGRALQRSARQWNRGAQPRSPAPLVWVCGAEAEREWGQGFKGKGSDG